MDNYYKVVSADVDGKLTGFLVDEIIDLLCEHLDGFACDVRTEEAVELVESLKADESA